MVIIILSILLVLAISLIIALVIALRRSLKRESTLELWFNEFQNDVVDTYLHLKEIDNRQMFEKDDDVGFIFSDMYKIIEKLRTKVE